MFQVLHIACLRARAHGNESGTGACEREIVTVPTANAQFAGGREFEIWLCETIRRRAGGGCTRKALYVCLDTFFGSHCAVPAIKGCSSEVHDFMVSQNCPCMHCESCMPHQEREKARSNERAAG